MKCSFSFIIVLLLRKFKDCIYQVCVSGSLGILGSTLVFLCALAPRVGTFIVPIHRYLHNQNMSPH